MISRSYKGISTLSFQGDGNYNLDEERTLTCKEGNFKVFHEEKSSSLAIKRNKQNVYVNNQKYVVSQNVVIISGNITDSSVGINNSNMEDTSIDEDDFQICSKIILEDSNFIDDVEVFGSVCITFSSMEDTSMLYPMINIKIQGSGKVLIPPISSIYKNLDIVIQGSGTVSSSTSNSIITESLKTKIQGSGKVNKIHCTRKVFAKIQGNGIIEITADKNTTISKTVMGLGSININKI
jgi:hypothetical protein